MDTSNNDEENTTPGGRGLNPPNPPQPQPYYPHLDDPLRLDVVNTTFVFDGRRVRVERRNQGVETIPLHLIASVSIQHVDTNDSDEPDDRLVVELTTGRTTSAGFHPPTRRQVQHWQEEVSRAVAGLEPTGQRPPPRGFPVGLVVVLLFLAAFVGWIVF